MTAVEPIAQLKMELVRERAKMTRVGAKSAPERIENLLANLLRRVDQMVAFLDNFFAQRVEQ